MGQLLVIKGADFSKCSVSKEDFLGVIAYEQFSYKQLFEENNILGIVPGFENGEFNPLVIAHGSPYVTDEIADTGKYSLKAFGNVSSQLKTAPLSGEYFIAARVKCTRYNSGKLGTTIKYSHAYIDKVTSSFQTVSTIAVCHNDENFIGSFNSADLDGYIDTPVCIDMSIFSTPPSVEKLTELYETYLRYK